MLNNIINNILNNKLNKLIDTHCHINMMVKKEFDKLLSTEDYKKAELIIQKAYNNNIKIILNVGTSLIESINSIKLAQKFDIIYASVGIHPNDLTNNWKKDLKELEKFILDKQKNKIVAIGECGIDLHYPGYNLTQQKDAFKTQIELALKNNLALIVHSRDAYQETLDCLYEFKNENIRGTIHCFSYDLEFAKEAISMGYMLGIDGPITYPKNNQLRDIVVTLGLDNIILETDAPFLPPQAIRGKQNHPEQIKTIAEFISNLINQPFEFVCNKTTQNAQKIFLF